MSDAYDIAHLAFTSDEMRLSKKQELEVTDAWLRNDPPASTIFNNATQSKHGCRYYLYGYPAKTRMFVVTSGTVSYVGLMSALSSVSNPDDFNSGFWLLGVLWAAHLGTVLFLAFRNWAYWMALRYATTIWLCAQGINPLDDMKLRFADQQLERFLGYCRFPSRAPLQLWMPT